MELPKDKAMVVCRYSINNSLVTFQLSRHSSFGQIKVAWSKETKMNASDHKFCLNDGRAVMDDNTLESLLAPNDFIVSVNVEPVGILIKIIFIGLPETHWSRKFSTDKTVEEILSQMCEELKLADREIRLLNGERLLRPKLTLKAQNIVDNSTLKADLVFNVTVSSIVMPQFDEDDEIEELQLTREPREGSRRGERSTDYPQEHVICFASQKASCLSDDTLPGNKQRLLFGKKVVKPDSTIIETFKGWDPLHQMSFHICLEHALEIQVERGNDYKLTVSEVTVWPSQLVRKLVKTPSQRVFYDGVPVSSEKTYADINAKQNSLFKVGELVTMDVRNRNGRHYCVHMPANVTVEEFQQVGNLQASGQLAMGANTRSTNRSRILNASRANEEVTAVLSRPQQPDTSFQSAAVQTNEKTMVNSSTQQGSTTLMKQNGCASGSATDKKTQTSHQETQEKDEKNSQSSEMNEEKWSRDTPPIVLEDITLEELKNKVDCLQETVERNEKIIRELSKRYEQTQQDVAEKDTIIKELREQVNATRLQNDQKIEDLSARVEKMQQDIGERGATVEERLTSVEKELKRVAASATCNGVIQDCDASGEQMNTGSDSKIIASINP